MQTLFTQLNRVPTQALHCQHLLAPISSPSHAFVTFSSSNCRLSGTFDRTFAVVPRSATTTSKVAAVAAAAAARTWRQTRCQSSISEPSPAALVVVEGDVVSFHMMCTDMDGNVLESSRETNQPLSFEIGAGEVTGNPLFQAFDGALRGLGVGESIELEISGGEWQRDLLFVVPRDHPEIERLEGRYKNQGGLQEGLAVELANNKMAVVVEATPEYVKLDANNMMSGKTLTFALEVLSIDRPDN